MGNFEVNWTKQRSLPAYLISNISTWIHYTVLYGAIHNTVYYGWPHVWIFVQHRNSMTKFNHPEPWRINNGHAYSALQIHWQWCYRLWSPLLDLVIFFFCRTPEVCIPSPAPGEPKTVYPCDKSTSSASFHTVYKTEIDSKLKMYLSYVSGTR